MTGMPISSLGTGTPRYFRFEFYNGEYTDYLKVYLFNKITHLESTTEIEAGNGISNVQCLIKYYKRDSILLQEQNTV